MRLDFLISIPVGLALALGPIAANAQTYDEVKRKAREVNARQATKRQQPPSWQVECKAKENQKLYLYQNKFRELDRRAKIVSNSFFKIEKDRLFINTGTSFIEYQAKDINKKSVFNSRVYSFWRSESASEKANNEVTESWTIVYYVAIKRGTSGIYRNGNINSDGKREISKWKDAAGWGGYSCPDQAELQETHPFLLIDISIKEDKTTFYRVSFPSVKRYSNLTDPAALADGYRHCTSCWDGEKPIFTSSVVRAGMRAEDEDNLDPIRNYVKYGTDDWIFGERKPGSSVLNTEPKSTIPSSQSNTSKSYLTAPSIDWQTLYPGYVDPDDTAEQLKALRLKEIKEAEIRFANEVRAADVQRAQGVKAVATNSAPALLTKEQIAQLETLKTSADQGDANAILQLCKAYYEGKQAKQDYTQAIVWCLPAGEQGNAEAQHYLGKIYGEGFGISKDLSIAVSWYRKAAEQGFVRSQGNLGLMYANGQGVAQDYAAAVGWFRKAANEGNANAQLNLGGMYGNGWGVAKDPAAAVSWYRKAADQGNANAQFNLGVMHYNGTGVAQDYTAAVSWYRKAAAQGDAAAQYYLGVMYDKGWGVAQDYEIAALWSRNGAEQGDAAAQYYLGFLYQRGAGVAQDSAVAVGWFRKAADQGYEPAKRALQNLGQ